MQQNNNEAIIQAIEIIKQNTIKQQILNNDEIVSP